LGGDTWNLGDAVYGRTGRTADGGGGSCGPAAKVSGTIGPVMGVGAGVEVDGAAEEVDLGVALPVDGIELAVEVAGDGGGGSGGTPAIATPAGLLTPADCPVMVCIGPAPSSAPTAYSITLSDVPSPPVVLPVYRFPAPSIAMASGRSTSLMVRFGGVSALHPLAYSLMLPVYRAFVGTPFGSASE
jgi:hypothetical protein